LEIPQTFLRRRFIVLPWRNDAENELPIEKWIYGSWQKNGRMRGDLSHDCELLSARGARDCRTS
jgi:hypothetical protein